MTTYQVVIGCALALTTSAQPVSAQGTIAHQAGVRHAAVAHTNTISHRNVTLAHAGSDTQGAVPHASAAPPSSAVNHAKVQTTAPVASPKAHTDSLRRGQLLNIKLDFAITSQVGTHAPIKKSMSMVVADGESSRIRTNTDFWTAGTDTAGKNEPRTASAPLNIDARPSVEGGKIRVFFTMDFHIVDPDGTPAHAVIRTQVSELMTVVLENGVPLVVGQASEAFGDNKVTIEIKGTILK